MDDITIFTVEIDHNLSTLNLVMLDSLNQDTYDESWGVSDVKIFVRTCLDGCSACPNDWGCSSCKASSPARILSDNCKCPS